jgi:Cu-processing system ATP-binding protein
MITISNLEKSFGKISVLKRINISFTAGQVTAIIGPNAAGKTTLIKCLLGMVIPDRGNIMFDGTDIRQNDDYRKDIGYMPQIGHYPDNMKVGQLFDMMKDIRNINSIDTLDEELIDAFLLHKISHKAMRTLSGGTRQKVSAALAFLFSPRVLILDEPTAGLDPGSAEILKCKIISARKDNKLILITSHIMSEVAEVADGVLGLHEGKVIFFKPMADILSETDEYRFSKAIVKLINQYQNVEDCQIRSI